MLLQEFQQIGADLFNRGLVSSHSGNLSVRLGDNLIITRRRAQLAHLTEHDLIETALGYNDRATPSASNELSVHRTLYQQTGAQAILHAHPVYTVAVSLDQNEVAPLDAEARRHLGVIPVLGDGVIDNTREIRDELAEALSEHKIVVVRGHGVFAVGQLLDETHHWASLLEESCRLIAIARMLGVSATEKGIPVGIP